MTALDMLQDMGVHGHFTLTTRDAKTGQIHEEVEADNLITNNGLQNLAYAFIYNLVQNQNVGWGSPISNLYQNLGQCFGALGTGNTTPLGTDVALTNEIARVLVTNAAVVSTNTFEVDFFFPTTMGNGVIAEVGMFTTAYLITTTLSSALVASTNYSTLSVAAWNTIINNSANNALQPSVGGAGSAASFPSGTIMCIGYGNNNSGATLIQYCKTTAQVNNGATSIPISAVGGGTFTANANYPIGSTLAYGPNTTGVAQPAPVSGGSGLAPIQPGVLFDHAVLGSTVTKNSSETATLGLQLTFTSA